MTCAVCGNPTSGSKVLCNDHIKGFQMKRKLEEIKTTLETRLEIARDCRKTSQNQPNTDYAMYLARETAFDEAILILKEEIEKL